MEELNKLCGNYAEHNKLRLWCSRHNPSLLDNFYNVFIFYKDNPDKTFPIANFNLKQNKYLYWHCPFDFVRKYLEEQCGYKKTRWFLKMFWKK